ncbi:hypothetical protein N7462_001727 [Penicillium macrosclerotiorum]|uniref:uncharacterized protein n=1 Tax=Penicillium macrosclerotiorum TaxID=303699 RepID=UPI0025493D93|nr:uncharacterized protein N7462_001727 [Penicillium macrosclerotiorum]KAJ5692304.1 hypothetical protein N7462_001727 [Penicillium macrosclerotiorum]
MRPSNILPTVLALVATGVSAVPHVKRELLAYRSWDLRLLSVAIPTCDVDTSNLDYSILHRYGAFNRDCEALDTTEYNATNVKSLSWKSPSEDDWHDLCMWSTADCSGGAASLLGSITSSWEMCYPYNGWVGFTVVDHGASCV